MKFTRTTYPDYPGAAGSPCWQVKGRWLWIDADWNTRPPYGTCLIVRIGPHWSAAHGLAWPRNGIHLGVNAPLGEPNRLGLTLGPWHITLGLPSVRDFRETGRETRTGRNGIRIYGVHFSNWLHPHIDGLDRYRYHQDDTGRWVRNPKPEPMHWGWLTVEKRR